MSPANEDMLDVMRYIATVGAYVEASIFLNHRKPKSLQYPDLSWAKVARSLLVRSLSVSLIVGRTIIQHISIMTVGSLDDR